MSLLLEWYWTMFIATEVLGFLCVVSFVLFRYVLVRPLLSKWSILLFVLLNVFDSVIAFFVYRATGELSVFQVIVFIFILYALTFGRSDFKKLDFWIRGKIEKWTKKPLISAEEHRAREESRYGAAQARATAKEWTMHAIIFVFANGLFWLLFPSDTVSLTDVLSVEGIKKWGEDPELYGLFSESAMNQVIRVWGIIFIIDTIFSWWEILSPDEKEEEKA